MSIEFCETCNKEIDTDFDVNGEHVDIEGMYFEYMCGDCVDKRDLAHSSIEAAKEDYGHARRRGEL